MKKYAATYFLCSGSVWTKLLIFFVTGCSWQDRILLTEMSRIGAVLFASVTLLTLSSTSSSLFSSHLLKPFRSMFNLRRRKISSQNAGDLIIHGTSRWESSFWKFLSSSSSSENHDCELEVVNNSNEVVIFCWVDFDGALHHFCPINDRSIRDGSVSNRHMESTSTDHVFVCIKSTPNLPRHVSDIDSQVHILFLFMYYICICYTNIIMSFQSIIY